MRTVVLSVPASDAELAADRLWCAGARAVEERATIDGAVEVRSVLGDDDAAARSRLGVLPGEWNCSFVTELGAATETWREFARPIDVTDELTIAPAWIDVGSEPGRARTVVRIEPGASFGLGDHPTTRLSAAAAWRLMQDGDEVLDVGCGSGVLAVVAVLGGARRVVAIDISGAAVDATRVNAAENGVSSSIEASTVPVTEIEGPFDLVLANILAPTLVSMATELRSLTGPSGRLVISGILADRHDHVLDALSPMAVESVDELHGWACVVLRHP